MSIVIPSGEANTAAAHPLSVFADLRLETDGHSVQLVGDGQSLVVHTSDPRLLFRDVRKIALPAAVSGRTGRTALGRAATALRDAGLRVDVRGPDGVLVRLGDGTQSRFGRIVTGSSAVQFVTAMDLGTAAQVPVRRIAVLVVTGTLVVAALLRLRRRWSSRPVGLSR